jgi:two-component system NarL family response regulator
MKVLLADENTEYLEEQRKLLEAADIAVAGTATDAHEVIEQTLRLEPDVVLMNAEMPGASGIAATRTLKFLAPAVRIVILAATDSDEQLFSALDAGATGYLPRNISAGKLLNALAELERDGPAVSPLLWQKILAEFARRDPKTGNTHTDETPHDHNAL